MGRDQRLELLTVILLAGFVLAVVVHYVEGFYLQHSYPFSTPLYLPTDKVVGDAQGIGVHSFGDFWTAWHQSRDAAPYIHPSLSFPDNYFPFTHLAMWPFAQLSYPSAIAIFLLGFLLAYIWIVWRTVDFTPRLTRVRMVIVLTAAVYPVVFLLDRGNVEGLVFLTLYAFVALLIAGRPRWAAVALGLGAAFKVAPLVLLLVFFKQRRWTEIGIVIAVGLVGTALGFLIVGGNIGDNIDGLRAGIKSFNGFALGPRGPQHDTSIYGLTEALKVKWHWLHFLNDIYKPLSYIFFLAAVATVFFRRLALWEQLTLLVAAMTIAPVNAYDYRLVEFLLPLFVLLRQERGGSRETLAIVLFGLLMIPKGLPVLYQDVTISVVLNPLIVIALAVVAGAGARRADDVLAPPARTVVST